MRCHILSDLLISCSDYATLNHQDCAKNLQLAFDVSEREFGIKPFITGKDLVSSQDPDKTSMSAYLSKFYELFRGTPLPPTGRPSILSSQC